MASYLSADSVSYGAANLSLYENENNTSDYKIFLEMLTAQLKNQDPLNPQQSTEFAAQLAAFSSVEQQVYTNNKLSDISSHMHKLSVSRLSDWVGLEVRGSEVFYYNGSSALLYPNLPLEADSANVEVIDNYGKLLYDFEISGDLDVLEFTGVRSNGGVLEPGEYTFRVNAMRAGEPIGFGAIEHYDMVVEASRGSNGEVTLMLDSGAVLLESSVRSVRSS